MVNSGDEQKIIRQINGISCVSPLNCSKAQYVSSNGIPYKT